MSLIRESLQYSPRLRMRSLPANSAQGSVYSLLYTANFLYHHEYPITCLSWPFSQWTLAWSHPLLVLALASRGGWGYLGDQVSQQDWTIASWWSSPWRHPRKILQVYLARGLARKSRRCMYILTSSRRQTCSQLPQRESALSEDRIV